MIIEIIISGPETLLFLEWTWYLSFWQFSEIFRCIPQIGHSNKLSDGYEIKERTVKIWIMLIMKGQRFFILRQHTDILSWLDIYYHKERSKFTPEKIHWWNVESDAQLLDCILTESAGSHCDYPNETDITAWLELLMSKVLINLESGNINFDP